MMQISLQQELSLLFPKSNKAVTKILESASAEQLKSLSEAKDLKAVLSQLMSETLDTSKSNKLILDIVKNSDFFKELGNFSKELQQLVELLKVESSSGTKLDKLLQNLKLSLLNFSPEHSTSLKDFVKNSGVFLESKLSQEYNPKMELKASLQDLKALLSQSEHKEVSKIFTQLDRLLKNESLFSKSSGITDFSLIKKEVSKLSESLKNIVKMGDPIHSKEVLQLVSKLETLSQNTSKTEGLSVSSARHLLAELSSELRVSSNPSTKSLNTQLETILHKLNSILKDVNTPSLLKQLSSSLQGLETSTLSKKQTQDFMQIKQELQTLSNMKFEDIEMLKFDDIKAFLNTLTDKISPLNSSSTKGIFDIIEKILSSLKQPVQAFNQENIPKDIKSWISSFEKEIAKADIVFSKSLHAKLDKISLFSQPAHLLDNKLLQENLQKDIKALLLGLEKELNANPSTGTNDIVKSVDKLLLQVDYFQLLSHLSNASVLYLPYAWDGLDNGKFSFKKSDDGSSYCEIDLELKEYGKLNLMLQLFDSNQLNMNIYTQSSSLKSLFKDNIKTLRSSLVELNIMPRNIHLYDLKEGCKKTSNYTNEQGLQELGFEVKG